MMRAAVLLAGAALTLMVVAACAEQGMYSDGPASNRPWLDDEPEDAGDAPDAGGDGGVLSEEEMAVVEEAAEEMVADIEANHATGPVPSEILSRAGNLAAKLVDADRADLALPILQSLLDPEGRSHEHTGLLRLAGVAAAEAQEFEDAFKYLHELIQIVPTVEVRFTYSQVLEMLGRYDEAITQFELILEEGLDLIGPRNFLYTLSRLITTARIAGKDGFAAEMFWRYKQRHPEVVLWTDTYQTPASYVPELTAQPLWKPRLFPDLFLLDNYYLAIRRNLEKYIAQQHEWEERGDQQLVEGGESSLWTEVLLFDDGAFQDEGCVHFPTTCNILLDMLTVTGTVDGEALQGQASILQLKPGTHLRAHNGPTNKRLTAHLGLIVPKGVSMRVANETTTWEEGKLLVFDDSFNHEVWHNGTEPRFILYVSMWHPDWIALKGGPQRVYSRKQKLPDADGEEEDDSPTKAHEEL